MSVRPVLCLWNLSHLIIISKQHCLIASPATKICIALSVGNAIRYASFPYICGDTYHFPCQIILGEVVTAMQKVRPTTEIKIL